MNKFTDTQLKLISNWHKFIYDYWPSWPAPIWFLAILDAILPTACVFNTAKWYKGRLVLYVPALCALNPFYEALFTYRTNK